MMFIRKLLFLSLCFVASAAIAQEVNDAAPEDSVQNVKHLKSYIQPTRSDTLKVEAFFQSKGIDIHDCDNVELYFEVYRWLGTKYKYGGNTSKGIDCSHFAGKIFSKVYGKNLAPDAGGIFHQCKVVKKGAKKAEEGDFLFFKIHHKYISHVGVYLQNGKFAHASTRAGVIVSSLEEPYYKKTLYKVGRLDE